MSRQLAELEDVVDGVRSVVDELRADVEDEVTVDAGRLLADLEAALGR